MKGEILSVSGYLYFFEVYWILLKVISLFCLIDYYFKEATYCFQLRVPKTLGQDFIVDILTLFLAIFFPIKRIHVFIYMISLSLFWKIFHFQGNSLLIPRIILMCFQFSLLNSVNYLINLYCSTASRDLLNR